VVGEIRGEEAFVLFQALATGHGGLTTLHADSLGYTVKRLTSHPMNVAQAYIPLLNVAPLVERVKLPASRSGGVTFGRRIKTLVEILDYENYKTVSQWNPLDDTFKVTLSESELLRRIASRNGVPLESILNEVASRAAFLRTLKVNGIKKNVDLSKQITNYYAELNHLGLRRQ
jgi:flagellar protein FlaI